MPPAEIEIIEAGVSPHSQPPHRPPPPKRPPPPSTAAVTVKKVHYAMVTFNYGPATTCSIINVNHDE